MTEGRFQARVREEIQRHLSEIVEFEARDPLIKSAFPTVMDVRLSPDGSHARIFVALGENVADREAVIRQFERDRGFFRSMLARRLEMRYTPELHFVLDETVERSMHLHSLLDEDDLREPEASPEEETQ
ncbi:MAG: 30S ribosome-binding factor RbfA [Candidatus Bipolaricaulota bacterium]|nr:MAG: 30S ribosome-binding factor RbfA [Candidatus Bipolaricaulota bacterium]